MIEKVLTELALVSGTSVQTYQEPIIKDYIQRGFDHLFKKRFWDHLTATTFHTLDGVAGVIDDAIVGIDAFGDIAWIRKSPFTQQDRIPYYRDGLFDTNLYGYTGLTWDDAQYKDKFIKFNPIDEALDIAIRARRRPDDFEDADIIPFDSLALVHFVTASVLAIDGMNPSAEDRQNLLFADRYEVLVMSESDEPIVSRKDHFSSEFTVAD